MPRRKVLTDNEAENLLQVPENQNDLIRLYTISEQDIYLINQNSRMAGNQLNLAVHWNTVYLDKAVLSLREHGVEVDEALLQHVSPLGWEHINLAGNYNWKTNRQPAKGKLRPLRPFKS